MLKSNFYLPVVPARGGAEVALKIYIYIYKTFLIYRTCMRRAPAKPVRACTLRNWCLVSHVTFEAPLHTSHLTVFTLHTTHFRLHSSPHFALHTPHSSHCTLRTPHFTLHTAHFTVHTSHCTLRTRNVTLHSPHFTLHPSCPTLHTAPFISTLHTHLTLHMLSFHESLPSTTTLACAVRQPGPCLVLCAKLLQCCCPRT